MADPAALYKTPEGYRAMMAWYDEMLNRLPIPVESVYVGTRWGRSARRACCWWASGSGCLTRAG